MSANKKPPLRRVRAEHLGPERRRPQVLDAALELVAKQGFAQLTMDALARHLGVTKPVLYSCFASREDLLTALLEREERRLIGSVMAALPETPDFSKPEQLLIDGFVALLQTASRHAASWNVVFDADPPVEVAIRYGQARQRVADQVGKLMRAGLAVRGTRDIARKLPVLVELFMSAGDGAVRALVKGDGVWTAEELGAFVGRIVSGALSRA